MKISFRLTFVLGIFLVLSAAAQAYADVPSGKTHADQLYTACDALDILKAKIHMAIYSALRYPASIAFYAARGITTVKYVYLNGRVSSVQIAESSGNRVLDRAALRAVREAQYPSSPKVLYGVKVPDVVYFVFDNSDLMARSDRPTDSGGALRRQLSKDEECNRK